MDGVKLAKAALGVVVVIILFVLVMNWWGDYRAATAQLKGAKATGTTTSTVTGGESGGSGTTQPTTGQNTTEPGATATVLLVTVDGLNFRAQPNGDSKAIRGLSKGERVTVLATQGDWYKVEDSRGVVGYITTNPTYTDTVD